MSNEERADGPAEAADSKPPEVAPEGLDLEAMAAEDDPPGPAEGSLTRPHGRFVPQGKPRRVARTRRTPTRHTREYTGEQRLLLLDTWQRSELPASEFSQLVGVATQTLSLWRRKFEAEGPAGLRAIARARRAAGCPSMSAARS